jgi:hypothetical protein
MNNRGVLIGLLSCLASYTSTAQNNKPDREGLVLMKTNYNGKPAFTDILKIWYRDSTAIEEIHRINIATDASNNTSISYSVLFYRYIDLNNRAFYDYKSFSDTARIFNRAVLSDSLTADQQGWNFYSEKTLQIQGTPEMMNDTIIDDITYKRAKLYFVYDDPQKSFIIAYFRCDGKGDIFSLEKKYSWKINCVMTKYSEFKVGKPGPYATIELEFTSDTLANNESKVFEAWERNAKQNPVNR